MCSHKSFVSSCSICHSHMGLIDLNFFGFLAYSIGLSNVRLKMGVPIVGTNCQSKVPGLAFSPNVRVEVMVSLS